MSTSTPSPAMPVSPLEEVTPRSLEVLFNTDPELQTEEETLAIMAELRKDRERFAAEPQKRPTKAPGATSPAKAKKTAASATLSLDDLGDLDL